MLKVICGQCYGITNFFHTRHILNAPRLIRAKCEHCNTKHWYEIHYPAKAYAYAETHLLILIMYPRSNHWFPPLQLIPELIT